MAAKTDVEILAEVKALLGISDTSKDTIIGFYTTALRNAARTYMNWWQNLDESDDPDWLERWDTWLTGKIISVYNTNGGTAEAGDGSVKKITEGDTTIEFVKSDAGFGGLSGDDLITDSDKRALGYPRIIYT